MTKNKYGKLGLKKKRLKPIPSEKRITYHDPCDLGRGCGVFEPPRKVLSSWSNFSELQENREYGNCCGGGGDLEMYNNNLAVAINKNLVKQIYLTNAETVVTACPQCKRMLLKELRKQKDIEVKDIAEFILENSYFQE